MKLLLPAAFLAVLSLAPLSAQQVILSNGTPAVAGRTLREDTTIRLSAGKFKLGLGDKGIVGTANAYLHDVVERTPTGADAQKAHVLDSSRNILLSFGSKNAEPKDQPGQLAGKSLIGQRADQRWKFELADKSKPSTEEAKALHQFEGYTDFCDALAHLYGTQERRIGETWKADLSALKKSAPDLDASLTCKLEEITEHGGARCARVSIQGTVTGSVGAGGDVNIQITGQVFRDLQQFIDAELDLAGTFKYKGAFGKGDNAAAATVEAPLTLKRTVKVQKR